MFCRYAAAAALAAVGLVAAACGSSSPASSAMSPGMPGMDMASASDGLSTSSGGYTFDSQVSTLQPGAAQDYRFRILGPDGKPQTTFTVDQTKLLHFYATRQDLTRYQHLHPSMAADGTWSVGVPLADPGPYRVYASFVARDAAGKDHALVLSRELTVPGAYQPAALPAPEASTDVDGYTLSLEGQLMGGMAAPLKVHVTRVGQPVTDLEPYLDAYAHLTAFRSQDLAFAHLHPSGGSASGAHGGPELTFQAEFPGAGDYRLFLQFQTRGRLHTAAVTVHAT